MATAASSRATAASSSGTPGAPGAAGSSRATGDIPAEGRSIRSATSTAPPNYIRARHFQEAMTVLSSVPAAERDARWYFLAGIANSGLGNKITAMEFAQRAVQLEPDNEEYRRFLDELQHGGTVYTNFSSGFPAGDWMTPNKLCLGLCAAQFLLRFCFCRC